MPTYSYGKTFGKIKKTETTTTTPTKTNNGVMKLQPLVVHQYDLNGNHVGDKVIGSGSKTTSNSTAKTINKTSGSVARSTMTSNRTGVTGSLKGGYKNVTKKAK